LPLVLDEPRLSVYHDYNEIAAAEREREREREREKQVEETNFISRENTNADFTRQSILVKTFAIR